MVESEYDVVVMVFSGRYGVPFVYEHCSVISIRLGRLFLLRERKRYRFGDLNTTPVVIDFTNIAIRCSVRRLSRWGLGIQTCC